MLGIAGIVSKAVTTLLFVTAGEDVVMHVSARPTTPEAEEQLLIPLRVDANPERVTLRPVVPDFDPGELVADTIDIELEIGPSIVCVYGCLVMNLDHAKVAMRPARRHCRGRWRSSRCFVLDLLVNSWFLLRLYNLMLDCRTI